MAAASVSAKATAADRKAGVIGTSAKVDLAALTAKAKGYRRFGQDGQGGPDGQQGWWGHHRFGQNGGMHNMSNSDDDSQL
jgi:hypothetical protein